MPLTSELCVWQINLAVEPGSGIVSRLNQRHRVAELLESQGFSIVVEPESRVSASRIRATHTRESAISLFLLTQPASVESVERIR